MSYGRAGEGGMVEDGGGRCTAARDPACHVMSGDGSKSPDSDRIESRDLHLLDRHFAFCRCCKKIVLDMSVLTAVKDGVSIQSHSRIVRIHAFQPKNLPTDPFLAPMWLSPKLQPCPHRISSSVQPLLWLSDSVRPYRCKRGSAVTDSPSNTRGVSSVNLSFFGC